MSEHIIILAGFSHFPTFQGTNIYKIWKRLKVSLIYFMSLDFDVPLSAQKSDYSLYTKEEEELLLYSECLQLDGTWTRQ